MKNKTAYSAHRPEKHSTNRMFKAVNITTFQIILKQNNDPMSMYWENASYPKFKTSVCLTVKTLRKN